MSGAFAQGHADLAKRPTIGIDAHAQLAELADAVDRGRRIQAVQARGQHAEGEAAIAVGGGAEGLVVGIAEHAIIAGPDQVDRLVRHRQFVGRCAGQRIRVRVGVIGGRCGRAGVIPQGAADDPQTCAFTQDIVVQGAGVRTWAIGTGSLAVGVTVHADQATAPTGEGFRQAAPGQAGIAAGDAGAIGHIDRIHHADLGADIDAGDIHTQAAAGTEAHTGWQVAWAIGGAANGDADQVVVAAGGEAISQVYVIRRQAAAGGKTDGNRGVAQRTARVGGEVGDLFVQAAEASFDDALGEDVAGGAYVAVDAVLDAGAKNNARLVLGNVADPGTELQHNAFQVVIVTIVTTAVGAVGDVAQDEGDGLVAVTIGA
ncbi:hypothetical protein D3C78_651580 [compost metagenome]